MIDKIKLITESNMIEGINRSPTRNEIVEFDRFMALDAINVNEMERFVKVYQPNARLRDKAGLDVIVGSYRPPQGGREIRMELAVILNTKDNPFIIHCAYVALH